MFNSTMPHTPRPMPAHSTLRAFWPNMRANSKVNRGTVAITNAATPEDTSFSATVTRPLPTAGISTPSKAAPPSSRALGIGYLRTHK